MKSLHTIMGLHILHPFPYMPRLGNPNRPIGRRSHYYFRYNTGRIKTYRKSL